VLQEYFPGVEAGLEIVYAKDCGDGIHIGLSATLI
jgi:hypothetical protein